jgi:hypothetical protein
LEGAKVPFPERLNGKLPQSISVNYLILLMAGPSREEQKEVLVQDSKTKKRFHS